MLHEHFIRLFLLYAVQKVLKNGFEGEMDPMLLLEVVTIVTIIIPVITL